METLCHKIEVTLFCKLNPIGTFLGPLNEVLCILIAQGAAKLPELKFGGVKKT